jgi:hypothetical protein
MPELDTTDANITRITGRIIARAQSWMRTRKRKNDENWDAYRGEQDWSHKADFQSRETTPSFPIAVDQIVGTFERALTDSDDWLLAEPEGFGKPFLEPDVIKGLVQFYATRLFEPGNHAETGYGIQVLVGDSVKRGILEPLVIAKVFPEYIKRRSYRFKKNKPDAPGAYPAYDYLGDEIAHEDVETMRLCVQLIGWDDYGRDPSPACRWEYHRSKRQLSELLANDEYDADVVRSLLGRANEKWETQERERSEGERGAEPDPYEIEVYEVWGDIVDERTGEVLFENVFWTFAGGALLRKPTPNPFWDGTRPFIVAPIIRVPGSAEPKALADTVVPMWRAANELWNLLLDGSMRAAWGVAQIRPDLMESPEEVENGIPQGYSAVLRPNVPLGAKFYERLDNGEVPQLAIEGLNRSEQYINEGLATPDTKLGQLPQRAVKATEIVQAMQASGSLYESFAARYEDTFLEPLFEKCWKIILQFADDFMQDELVQILGPTNTIRLTEMSAVQRWRLLHKTTFKVRGLRGLAAKEREFQKLMTLVNLLSTNPQFADHFGQEYDFGKLWDRIIRASGNDPAMLKKEDDGSGSDDAAESGSAGGQLDPTLNASSGASQPNISTTVAAQRGEQSALAPNNPNDSGVAVGA